MPRWVQSFRHGSAGDLDSLGGKGANLAELTNLGLPVPPGFTVELMAAEPLVQSPIAFAWGPDGKFWVVEMGDYPLGLDGKGKPGGRVKYLTRSRENGPFARRH